MRKTITALLTFVIITSIFNFGSFIPSAIEGAQLPQTVSSNSDIRTSSLNNQSSSEFSSVSKQPDPNAPKIQSVTLQESSYKKYGLVEIEVKFSADYVNPFDLTQIVLDGEFTTPSGKKMIVPGFVTKAMIRNDVLEWGGSNDSKGSITKDQEIWKIRFSYNEIGNYSVRIRVKDKHDETISDSKSFQIVDYLASDSIAVKQQGLIEINSYKQYFQYRDSKKDFYPVGYQLPWSWPKTFQNYEENAIKMAENGGNFTRIWGSGIEQTMSVENKNYGVGRYQINNAQAQDLVLDMFRQKGIKVEYAFDSFNSFQSAEQWYGEWKNNPYNSANSGGFLSKPAEFFTSEKAISLYEQKLRYCIARWGWDANLAIWEIMNEIDGVEPFYTNKADIILWIDEIAKYIKSTDYYKRPVAMSFAKAEGHPGINSLNSIDLVTVHFYNQNDIASAMSNFIKTSNIFGKPVVVGEFGPDSGDFDRCRNGVNLQEGIWSSIASGSANVAQYWWWDELINPDSLYVQMDPISRFVASFEFSKEKLNDLPATSSVTQMRALGRINEGKTRGLIWIQNKNNLWKSIAVNGKAPSLNNVTLTVSAANGDYEVYEWDTWAKGKAPIKTIMTVSDGKLVLIINNLEIDRAFTFSKR